AKRARFRARTRTRTRTRDSCARLNAPMDGHALSAAVLAMATFAIGLSVYLRGRIQRSLQRFLILCLGVCLWHVAAAIHGYAWGPDWWRRVWGVSPLLVAVWLPSASLRFFAAFLRAERRKVP